MKDKNMSNILRQNVRVISLLDYELHARALRAQAMREMVAAIGKAPGALFVLVRKMRAHSATRGKAGQAQRAA